ncbi:MAG: hypothetical protein NW216_14855 [Hyphomicrobium sp.]|nr:hypothetical protein [Hyphomicrobium sp.]
MRPLMAILVALVLQTAQCKAEDWQTVAPEGLGFSIAFPVRPSDEAKDVELRDGSVAKYRTFQILNENVIYDMTVIDYPAGSLTSQTAEQVIDGARDGLVTDFPDAKLRSEAKIELAGRPAREVLIESMGMIIKGRMLPLGDRLYYVGTIAREEVQASATVQKFVASFKLTDTGKR